MAEASVHQSTANPAVWHVRLGRRVRRVVICPERGGSNPWAAEAAVRTIAEEMARGGDTLRDLALAFRDEP